MNCQPKVTKLAIPDHRLFGCQGNQAVCLTERDGYHNHPTGCRKYIYTVRLFNKSIRPGVGLSSQYTAKIVDLRYSSASHCLQCQWQRIPRNAVLPLRRHALAPPTPKIQVRRQIQIGPAVRADFPTFISCQRQDSNVLPKRRQSHQGGQTL